MIIRNEENFAEKRTLSFNYAKVCLLASFIFVLIFGIGILFDRFVIGSDSEAHRVKVEEQVITLSEKVDSLENELDRGEAYIHSFKTMINGGELAPSDSSDKSVVEASEYQGVETSLEAEEGDVAPEKNKGYQIIPASTGDGKGLPPNTLYFPPLSGFQVSEKYNPKLGQFGVRIDAKENEPVTAVSDGTIVMATFTSEDGYIIAVQHANNIISIYKHNSVLLKKVGNYVKAGDLIAIVGAGGEAQDAPHLQFELWQKGGSLNPEHFISF